MSRSFKLNEIIGDSKAVRVLIVAAMLLCSWHQPTAPARVAAGTNDSHQFDSGAASPVEAALIEGRSLASSDLLVRSGGGPDNPTLQANFQSITRSKARGLSGPLFNLGRTNNRHSVHLSVCVLLI